MEKKFIDSIVLSSGHSMVVSAKNLAKGVGCNSLKEEFFKKAQSKTSVEKYGLFSGVMADSEESFNKENRVDVPSGEEYVTPTYRLLSNTIVAKDWLPTLFPENVLKESMHLMEGQTVFTDHSWSIDNAIGSVQEVYWQDSYVTDDGLKIPAGINGVFKIDAKSNPKIARGIMMDPPSIHSNSVTVRFEWVPSHPGMDIHEFWSKIGSYDADGKLIHRIATKIISYNETSLVWAGADPFAKKIGDDGHIILPQSAKANSEDESHYSFKGFSADGRTLVGSEQGLVDSCTPLALYDFKSLSLDNTKINNNKQPINKMNTEEQEKKEQDSFVQKLIDQGIFGESVNTPELIISSIQSLKSEKDKALNEVTSLNEQLKTLKGEVETLKKEATATSSYTEAGKIYRKTMQDEAVEAYTKVMGEKVDNTMLETLKSDETSLSVIKAIRDTYTQSLEDKFPMACNDCGSHNVSRSSHISRSEEGESSFGNDGESIKDTIKSVLNKSKNNK